MINGFATRCQVEQLFCAFKSDNSNFKNAISSKKCDPLKLKTFFKDHFTGRPIEGDPIELVEATQLYKTIAEFDDA